MRNSLLALSLVLVGGLAVVEDAEARRFGGARSLGVQRNITAPPAKPAQAAPQPHNAPAAAPAAGQSKGRWGGILGGLALGGLLGYLFGGNGLLGMLAIAIVAWRQ